MKILNTEEYETQNKLDLGGGRLKKTSYINLDITGFVDNGGVQKVDIVIDIEKEKLPFDDKGIIEILADNIFEHLGDGFIFALNECHRVLSEGGILKGCVPVAGTPEDFKDITHKRHFTMGSFGYLCGRSLACPDKPTHPKYADYGVLPWISHKLERKGNLIYFELSPRKINKI